MIFIEQVTKVHRTGSIRNVIVSSMRAAVYSSNIIQAPKLHYAVMHVGGATRVHWKEMPVCLTLVVSTGTRLAGSQVERGNSTSEREKKTDFVMSTYLQML